MRLAKPLGAALLSLSIAAVLVRVSSERDRWVRADMVSPSGTSATHLTLDADGPIQGWLRSSTPSLSVSCTSGGDVEFAVVTRLPADVEPGNQRSVRYQFDGDEEVLAAWHQSANRQTLTAPPQKAAELARRLAEATRFSFAYIPFNAEPAFATFTLSGFLSHWREVEAACGAD